MSDATKESNINLLTSEQLESLNKQIEMMIRNKYNFINYNGLSFEKFKNITSNLTVNIFDNSVVIIDEAHNLISRIVNRINKKDNPSNTLSLIIYEMLLKAKNSRIVLLTGTPIVNYPNEIGILFNILRGVIKTWSFKLTPRPGTSQIINYEILKEALKSNLELDYMEYVPTSQTLTITRNPFGFKNKFSRNDGRYKGVMVDNYISSDEEFQDNIIKLLQNKNINIIPNKNIISENLALPDKLDEFFNYFIETDNNIRLKNPIKFKQRIMGLTSYFRSAQEELLPRYDKTNTNDRKIVELNMSDSQFMKYAEYRKQERDTEKTSLKKNAMNKGTDLYKQQSSTYRLMSRLACNITLPGRPNPIDFMISKKKDKEEIEEKEEKELSIVVEPKENKPPVRSPSRERRPKLTTIPEVSESAISESKSEAKKRSTSRPKSSKREQENLSEDIPLLIEPESEEKPKIRARSRSKSPSKIEQSESEEKPKMRARSKTPLKIEQPESKPQKSNSARMLEEHVNEFFTNNNITNEELKMRIKNSILNFENSSYFTNKRTSYDDMTETNRKGINSWIDKYITKMNKDPSKVENDFTTYFNTEIEKAKSKSSTKKGGSNIFKYLIGGEGSDDESENIKDDTLNVTLNEKEIIEDILEETPDENVDAELEQLTNQQYGDAVKQFMDRINSSKEEYLSIVSKNGEKAPLMEHSPKYFEMINRISSPDNIGLHLVYSQFRNVEGLALFGMALDTNGFKQFKIRKIAGEWDLDRDFESVFMRDDIECYVFYTGEESNEERAIMRNIYNGDWDDIPRNISEKLKRKTRGSEYGENNNYGQIIKILMITAAGAEGINLRNTRFVHIMEPYWHPVRTEQVIGRARRICSHKNLPLELQTVQVFIYISVMTPSQLSSQAAVEIRKYDMPEITLAGINDIKPETSDQKLLSLSTTKEIISESILKAVKESSVDCAIHMTGTNKEGLTCLAYSSNDPQDYSYAPDYENEPNVENLTKTLKIEYKKITTPDGRKFLLKSDTGDLFNPSDISMPNPNPVGKLMLEETIDKDGNPISKKSVVIFK
jgi:hypothetical protein